MKIDFDDQEIQGIAERVAEIIMPKIESCLFQALNRGADELLTIDEAAALLKRSKGQIYQWVHSAAHGLSDFPSQKQGKQLRFSRRKLMNWKSSENGRGNTLESG